MVVDRAFGSIVQCCIIPLPIQQFFMRALLNNMPFVHHDNAVGIFNSGQAVGDDDAGASVHQVFQSLLHQMFAFVVECAGGFVQKQDGCVFQDGAGDGYALALSARKLSAVDADGLVHAFGVVVYQV